MTDEQRKKQNRQILAAGAIIFISAAIHIAMVFQPDGAPQ